MGSIGRLIADSFHHYQITVAPRRHEGLQGRMEAARGTSEKDRIAFVIRRNYR
jgi:hypothetical protein